MKSLGLLGGMSWESTVTYYQVINRRVRQVRGGLHSAQCIVLSFDFALVEDLQRRGEWAEAGRLLERGGQSLKAAGADAIVLCTNTMHMVAGGIEASSGLPLIHIVDATAARIVQGGHRTVGLVGTKFTMEKDFYKARLRDKYKLEVVVPERQEDRDQVHAVIYDELCHGIVRDQSRQIYVGIVRQLVEAGAQCLILGCTEIGLLLRDSDIDGLPLFDTTEIHATAAADWSMEERVDSWNCAI